MLLTIEEIEFNLKEKFAPLSEIFELDELILKRKSIEKEYVNLVEQKLGVKLPDDFINLITNYDFDNFSLGNVAFGSGDEGYLNLLINFNSSSIEQWWLGDQRPNGYILIAMTDPYSILLNTLNNGVYVMTSESKMGEFELVANNFNIFFRAMGSIFLKVSSVSEIEDQVGAISDSSFWKNIAG